MRLILALLIILSGVSLSRAGTYEKLCEVNVVWKEHQSLSTQLPATRPISETQWIQLHLSLVEQQLRCQTPSTLNTSQLRKRLRLLDTLHAYGQTGRFPQNEEYDRRLPIFIDRYNTFCAVGYLLKASGQEDFAREISRRNNLVYIRQIGDERLDRWASAYGFTKDELAWIQPSYAQPFKVKNVGKGTNGEVFRLLTDATKGRLYVGGSFDTVDGNIAASNIAFVTQQNDSTFTWHPMGQGLNGTVRALTIFHDTLFAGGDFTMSGDSVARNVAWWDGSRWRTAGCIYGRVNDLEVYQDRLYAGGDFDVCASLSEVNFARWTGSYWQSLGPIEGHINALSKVDTSLVIAGLFKQGADSPNILLWSPGTGYNRYDSSISREVYDVCEWHGSTFAVVKGRKNRDPLIYALDEKKWQPAPYSHLPFSNSIYDTTRSIKKRYTTLFAARDALLAGGNGDYKTNGLILLISYPGSVSYPGFDLDSTVNSFAVFNKRLFMGGAFVNSSNPAGGMGYVPDFEFDDLGIPKPESNLNIYPNPVTGGAQLHCTQIANGTEVSILNSEGQLVQSTTVNGSTIDVPKLIPGIYQFRIGNTAVSIVVQ